MTDIVLSSSPSATAKRVIGAVVVLLLGVVIAVGVWLAYKPTPVQLQGMVEMDDVHVATKVPSRIQQLLVDEGAAVRVGQALVVLSSPEVEAKLQQAEGALQSALALQSTALRGSQPENLASLKANWDSAEAGANLARKTDLRAGHLWHEGVISAQRRDEALAARQSAEGLAEAARQQYIRAQRGSTHEQLQSANAQVSIAQAALTEARALRTETQLTSPISGEVAKRFGHEGELIPLGVPIYTLIDVAHPWVSLHVREDQLNGLQQGQILYGQLPALNLPHVSFTISHIAVEGAFATWRATRQSSGYDIRTFEVRLTPTQPIQGLRSGMSALFDWPKTP